MYLIKLNSIKTEVKQSRAIKTNKINSFRNDQTNKCLNISNNCFDTGCMLFLAFLETKQLPNTQCIY